MTTSTSRHLDVAAAGGHVDDVTAQPDDRLDIAASVTVLMRAGGRVKERLAARAQAEGLDWSSFGVLRPLMEGEPQRITTLAERLHLNPSSVSRQVTQLIAEGLLERRADAADGRACIVAPTDVGAATFTRLQELRDEYVTGVLADWDAADVAALARLLHRFADAVDADAGRRGPSPRVVDLRTAAPTRPAETGTTGPAHHEGPR